MKLKQVAIAFDQLLNAILGGWSRETLSSRAWRQQHKKRWAIARKVIDAIFFWERDHCKTAYESEVSLKHLPPMFRE